MQEKVDSFKIEEILQKNSDKAITQQAEALYDVFQMDKFLFAISLTESKNREDRIRNAKDINVKGEYKQTVLYSLVYRGNTQLYNMAIELGADPHIIARDHNKGKINLMYSASITPFYNKEIIESLVYDHGLDPNGYGKSIPLFHAIECGYFNTFQTLLAVGADPYKINSDGYNILFYALLRRKTNIIQYIVKTYPKLLFEPNRDNDLPIDIMGRGYTKTVKKIIETVYEKELKKRKDEFGL